MPTVTNAKLTFEKDGTKIRITVTYDINLSRLESNIAGAGLGIRFSELVQVIGIDPPGSTTGTTMQLVAVGTLTDVVHQDAPQTLTRSHTRTFSRASLDEDRSLIAADNDELRCRIRLLVHGLPKDTINVFTNQIVLIEEGPVNK